MTTIKTKVENVLNAHEKGSQSDKELLEKLYPELFKRNVRDLVNSYKEACEYNKSIYNDSASGSTKVKEVVKAFRNGWVVDYANSNQGKYYPYFIYKVGSGFSLHFVCDESTSTLVGAPFVSENAEICRYIATHPEFLKYYNEMLLES